MTGPDKYSTFRICSLPFLSTISYTLVTNTSQRGKCETRSASSACRAVKDEPGLDRRPVGLSTCKVELSRIKIDQRKILHIPKPYPNKALRTANLTSHEIGSRRSTHSRVLKGCARDASFTVLFQGLTT